MNLTQTIIGMASAVVPLVPIVMALTQWVKSVTGTSDGRVLNACAMLFGIVLGVAVMVAQQMPAGFADWLIVAMYGVTLGLTASGLYKVGLEIARKTSPLAVPDGTLIDVPPAQAPH